MPSSEEHQTLMIPQELSIEELARDWTLSEQDLELALSCRGEQNRLRFVIQLCTLRHHGRFLPLYSVVPASLLNHLARQMGLSPLLHLTEPERPATESSYRQRLRAYLGFSIFSEEQRKRLEKHLIEEASDCFSTPELELLALETLRQWKVIPPKRSTLSRLVTSINLRNQEHWLEQIASSLDSELIEAFEQLLIVPEEQRTSDFYHLKLPPPEGKPKALLQHLARFEQLQKLRVMELQLERFDQTIIQQLAERASRYDAEDLKRFERTKRRAMLACFLVETVKTTLDQIIWMHDQCVTAVIRRSRNALQRRREEERRKARQGFNTLLTTMEAFIDQRSEDTTLEELLRETDWEQLEEATRTCRALQRTEEYGIFDELRARQSYLKQYLVEFLSLPFQGEKGAEPLLLAIEVFLQLAQGEIKQFPGQTPVKLGPLAWSKGIQSGERGIDRRMWELALAFEVRDALRSGELYLAQSRHHISFWNLVYNESRWEEEREQAYQALNLPAQATDALSTLQQQFHEVAHKTSEGFSRNPFATISLGKLKLKKRDSLTERPQLKQLRRVVMAHIPGIRIEKLLAEVDAWCSFSREFRHLSTYKGKAKPPYSTLLAALVAHGTNLGIAAMGESTEGITADMLSHATRWLLRPDTLKAANKALVDFHHTLPLSQFWGTGRASSSDGQRFGIQSSSLLSSFYPRYFGYYDRAINVYTHVSDQFSVFSSRAISCSVREAIYVLDGLLENDTLLQPQEHYTDTHGYTEHLFGLCYLLGFSFMPRIRDLKDQRLYRISRDSEYGPITPLFQGYVNFSLLEEQWDQLVRVAASLLNRTAPAHIVLQRLAANSPSDRVAKALTELGRLVKTTYILQYINDGELRRRVHLQLNRGEARHSLARRLFFANQGLFRERAVPEIMNKVSSLSLLSNAVLVWNTVRMSEVVERLRASGHALEPTDLARLSPLAYKHVIPSGTYLFTQEPLERTDAYERIMGLE